MNVHMCVRYREVHFITPAVTDTAVQEVELNHPTSREYCVHRVLKI